MLSTLKFLENGKAMTVTIRFASRKTGGDDPEFPETETETDKSTAAKKQRPRRRKFYG